MFTDKKREGINTFVCAVSLYGAETLKASIRDHEPQLPIIPFGIVAYGFVGQPFSKQLYSKLKRVYSMVSNYCPNTIETVFVTFDRQF